jgi:alpha-tubulin suppressor-like RCC1 family protein
MGITDWVNALKPGKLKEDSYHSKNNIHEPMLLAALKGVRIRHVGRGPEAGHMIVVDESGQAWSWGNNDFGQLGQGDTRCRRIPTPIPGTGPEGHNIVMVSMGNRHSLLLSSLGKVLVAGDNSDGQCGVGEMKTKDLEVGKTSEEVETCSVPMVKELTSTNYNGVPVIKVSAGSDFSMILDLDGCVWTFGSQEFGQIATGTDGGYNSANSKVKMRYAGVAEPYKVARVYERDSKNKKTKSMQMMKIKSISAGSHHAAMVDELGRVFTWGAGSYGRTGLGDTMDTFTPVWISALDHPRGKIESVECGHMMSVMYGKLPGTTFMAGVVDNIRKEANMTPKQYFELGDTTVQNVSFWKKGFSAVGEDGKVTVTNNGPCYGEVGNGDRFRTQGIPKKMKELEFAHVMMVGTGCNSCVYVLRDSEPEDEEEMEEYDVLDQTDIEYTE